MKKEDKKEEEEREEEKEKEEKKEETMKEMLSVFVDDTIEYYTAEKNNDIMKFAGKWMELENVILSEMPMPSCPGRSCSESLLSLSELFDTLIGNQLANKGKIAF
ncbi:hypothetical protein STEG23_033000 [Scotinomys teguina]